MSRLKIVQIGVGHDHAFAAVSRLTKLSDLFDYVGYVITERDRGVFESQKALYDGKREYSLEDVLKMDDLDAVAIETYDHDLVKYAQLFLEKGVHVYMDKPGSQNDEEFDRLIETAQKKNLVLEIGYMYRFNPAVQYVKKLVLSGKLGEIYSVEAHMDCDHTAKKRQWLKDFKGGMTFFLGCHLVDLILQMQGVPEKIVPFNTATGFQGVESEDVGCVLFEYKNGVSFLKTSAVEAGGFQRRQLVVCGTKGTVKIEPLERFVGGQGSLIDTEAVVYKRGNAEFLPWGEQGERIKFEPFERYDGLFTEFYRLVKKEKTAEQSLEYEKTLHKVLLNACGIQCDYKKGE